jgi:hypothetical protein
MSCLWDVLTRGGTGFRGFTIDMGRGEGGLFLIDHF